MTETTTCKICSAEIVYTPIEGLTFKLTPTVCDRCGEKRQREELEKSEAATRDEWKHLCPPLFQETDLNHPHMPSGDKQEKVLNWKYSPMGLLVRGKTRKGKTRLVWALIKRLITDQRLSVKAITSSQFATDCASACGEGGDALTLWKDDLCGADVLFIDDLGKFKMTERVEAELFDIIDRRISDKLPLIITTNYTTGEELAGTMSKDRGPAVVSRLREFCQAITI